MAKSKMQNLQSSFKYHEGLWKKNIRNGEIGEAYAEADICKQSLEEQKAEYAKMDPNSPEYEKTGVEIDRQSARLREMESTQANGKYNQQGLNDYENARLANERIADRMQTAVEKGDTKTYDSLRAEYEHNIKKQELLGKRNDENGLQYKDTVHQQRLAKQDLDIDMRNKIADKVANRTAKGKPVSQEDREALERYSNDVKRDEIENVKKQNEKVIQGMRERGVDERVIAARQEENERTEKWVESINR